MSSIKLIACFDCSGSGGNLYDGTNCSECCGTGFVPTNIDTSTFTDDEYIDAVRKGLYGGEE